MHHQTLRCIFVYIDRKQHRFSWLSKFTNKILAYVHRVLCMGMYAWLSQMTNVHMHISIRQSITFFMCTYIYTHANLDKHHVNIIIWIYINTSVHFILDMYICWCIHCLYVRVHVCDDVLYCAGGHFSRKYGHAVVSCVANEASVFACVHVKCMCAYLFVDMCGDLSLLQRD